MRAVRPSPTLPPIGISMLALSTVTIGQRDLRGGDADDQRGAGALQLQQRAGDARVAREQRRIRVGVHTERVEIRDAPRKHIGGNRQVAIEHHVGAAGEVDLRRQLQIERRRRRHLRAGRRTSGRRLRRGRGALGNGVELVAAVADAERVADRRRAAGSGPSGRSTRRHR